MRAIRFYWRLCWQRTKQFQFDKLALSCGGKRGADKCDEIRDKIRDKKHGEFSNNEKNASNANAFNSSAVFMPEFMLTTLVFEQQPSLKQRCKRHSLEKSTSKLPALTLAGLRIGLLCALLLNSAFLEAATDSGEFGSAIDYTMYKLAVERNDASAQYLVGRNFLKGKTVTKNVNEAIKWFKRAAEQNHQQAQYTLGRIYFYGNGIKRNTTLGLKYIEQAADNGLGEAQLFLGNYYLGNYGGKADRSLAKKWLLSASEYNNPRAQYLYGKLLIESGSDKDNEIAIKWLRNASEAGLVEAAKLLGHLRKEGKEIQRVAAFAEATSESEPAKPAATNTVIASTNAAKQHDSSGASRFNKSTSGNVGNKESANITHTNNKASASNSVKTNHKTSAESIATVKVDKNVSIRSTSVAHSASALFGQVKLSDSEKKLAPNKQFNLAMDYINGEHGVKKDLSRGISLLVAAAHRDNPRAQYTYGLMLRDGAGVDKDMNAALAWLQKAADAGLSSAKREYDNLKLRSMLSSSDNNPDKPAAQYSLGLRLLKGDGIKKDDISAARWILKAAKQNYHEAEARIGSMYRQGIGVEKDARQAKRWLEKAADAGVLSAARELKDMQDDQFKSLPSNKKTLAGKESDSDTLPLQKAAFRQKSFPEKDAAQGIAISTAPQPAAVKPKTATNKKAAKKSEAAAEDTPTAKASENKAPSADDNKLAMLASEKKEASAIDKNSDLFPLLQKAEKGDSGAQFQIGVQLLNENPGKQALNEGIKWLTLAANNHHLPAQMKLAKLYQSGAQVKRDLKKAYDWYLTAANSGDDSAQLMLGDMYRSGEGVSADNSEAIRWYRKAANQGNPEARHRLGGCRIC